MSPLFDPENFARMVRYHVAERNLTGREAARQVGVSPATMCRIMNGKAPDVENYLRLKRWMES